MELYQSVEEFKNETDVKYKKYLTDFIYKGLENIFPTYQYKHQLSVIAGLMFSAVDHEDNSTTVAYFTRVVRYTKIIVESLIGNKHTKQHERYFHLVNDLYQECINETLMYYVVKERVHSGKSLDLFCDLD